LSQFFLSIRYILMSNTSSFNLLKKEEDFCDVVVTEVTNVDNFYINIRSAEALGAREKLMDCMNIFYDTSEGNKLSVDRVCPGMVVAAPYFKEGYHRARVVRYCEEKVVVDYLDFGTVGVVSKSDLRLLPKMFKELPFQAIKSYLWGVEDSKNLAGDRFLELVEKGNRLGGFVAILKGKVDDSDPPSLGLWLIDTASNNLPDGKSLNYTLWEEGLVTFSKKVGRLSNRGQVVIDQNKTDGNSSEDSSFLAAVDRELDECDFIREVVIDGVKVHFITLSNDTWITSRDVASLIEDWRGRDILSPMLARKKVELETLIVRRPKDSILIDQFLEAGVAGINPQTMAFTLYRIVNVPSILNLFMVTKSRQRMSAVSDAIQHVNNPYEHLSTNV